MTPKSEPAGAAALDFRYTMDLSDKELSDPPKGQCPSCGLDVPLLSPDDLRAHIHPTNGEYCPGSRGAPVVDNP